MAEKKKEAKPEKDAETLSKLLRPPTVKKETKAS